LVNLRINKGSVNCIGDITPLENGTMVDCRSCNGPGDLSLEICFKGLSERWETVRGDTLILRGDRDRSYRDSILIALRDHSNIQSMFNRVLGSNKDGGIDRYHRKLMMEMREDFMNGPSGFQKREKKYRKRVKDEKISLLLDDIFESVSLMIRRLERR
jgi:hypothetical protein